MIGPDQLAPLVRQALSAAGLPDREPAFERPRQREHGDWATNVALTLAKPVGKPPREVAESIVAHLPAHDGVDAVEVAGPGFLNFRLSHGAFQDIVREAVRRAAGWGRAEPAQPLGSVNVEFVSANPTGPLHVGAGRWAAAGDAIAALLDAAGWTVTREYYLNDAGNQMELFAESVHAVAQGRPVPENGYQGAYVSELAAELAAAGVDAADLGEQAYRRTRARIEATLERFGVTYDVWFSERSLHDSGAVDRAVARLREGGWVDEVDGALFLRTTELGDDKDRVLIRSDGRPTYFAADCAYMLSKAERGATRAVYLLGADHHGYVRRLQAVARALGLGEDWLEVIIGQLVNLYRGGEAVRMSKRTGEMVTFDELIDEVGRDAARYTFLRTSLDVTLDFDIAEVVKQERDNPVYYVQYSHARIAGILRTARERGLEPGAVDDARLELLTHPAEEELIRRVGAYPETVAYAAAERAPHKVARYAEDLAEGFHRFYTECQVVGEDAELSRARWWLVMAAKQTLVNALGLLGVDSPDRM
ncbi:MAG TPA: arginine--tRNA ligase [Egibacteraceae bacterium]|nr:arginine--tRNA ligase [Egibacteraceae bacterium]